MKTHEYWMAMAIAEAERSAQNGGGPFGCVIVKNGELVACSTNSVTRDNDPTAHAEVNAIRMACKQLSTFNLEDCVLYTSCEPCPMCLAACYWAHIERIYFAGDRVDAANAGFDDDHIYEEFKVPIDQRKIAMEQILSELGTNPFLAWEQNNERTEY